MAGKKTATARNQAVYQKIMASMLRRMESGEFSIGDQIPSEHQLVTAHGVSRMTVNRALTELASQGYINRVQGVGSFVADTRPHSSLLGVPDIAADIRRRGHQHRARVIALCADTASPEVAAALEIRTNAGIYHSVLVHYEENLPVQLEERHVRKEFAPEYLAQNFEESTPYQYLLKQGRIHEVEHTLHAAASTKTQQRLLNLSPAEPCLVLTRRTWSNQQVVTFGRFFFPGSRYRLFSHYTLNAD